VIHTFGTIYNYMLFTSSFGCFFNYLLFWSYLQLHGDYYFFIFPYDEKHDSSSLFHYYEFIFKFYVVKVGFKETF